jgi:hypothetical protein
MAKIYRGKRLEDGLDVSVLVLDRRQRKRVRPLRHIPFHSPDGFAWGYYGSGPADLALAMLVDYLRERPPHTGWLAGAKFSRWTVDSRAFAHHQDFKREVVAQFGDAWELSGLHIDAWLKDHP